MPETPQTNKQQGEGLPTSPSRLPAAPAKSNEPTTGLPSRPGLPTRPDRSNAPAGLPSATPALPTPAPTPAPALPVAPPNTQTPAAPAPPPAHEPVQHDLQHQPPAPAALTHHDQAQEQTYSFTPPPARYQESSYQDTRADDDYDYEEEAQRRKPRKEPQGYKRKNPTKGNKKTEKVPGFSRQQFLIMRYLMITGIVILAGMGVKNAILPVQPPDSEEVVASVFQTMGISEFPAEQAEGFALAYTRTLLTLTPDTLERRKSDLARYYREGSIEETIKFPTDVEQRVIDGPYVFGVRYVSDHSAVFTIGSRINDGSWIYLAVNVFYDRDERTYSIARGPTLVPEPHVAKLPPERTSQRTDEIATEAASAAINTYFAAWAASNLEEMSVVLAPDADARAYNGLGGKVTLVKISDLAVFEGGTSREASVTVTWLSTSKNRPIEYKSAYKMLLVQAADRWLVKDIRPQEFQ